MAKKLESLHRKRFPSLAREALTVYGGGVFGNLAFIKIVPTRNGGMDYFMNIRFYNARILTMTNLEVTMGELWVQNGIIVAVGKPQSIAPVWNREINANGNLLMPGFKNAHTHSAMTFLRSYADDLPLLDWLQKQVFPMEAKLRSEHISPLCKLAIMEYLQSGITACFDMYMFPQEMAKASIDVGFRTVLCGCYSDFVNTIENLEKQHEEYNSYHNLISHHLGFHAEYTTDKEKLIALASLAQKLKAPVYTHNSESLRETLECVARTGKSPTQYMASLGLFEYGGGFYHGVHLNSDDIKLCQEKNIAVITNPASNTKLASGIAPLCEMLEGGVLLGIGTDGAASNNCLDIFREMFLACGLQKLKQNRASAMPAEAVLKMATTGSAKIMGLTNSDTLEIGKNADLIMLNLNRPNMQPINNIPNNIVYSASKENVMLTMVAGNILYENGCFNTIDSEAEIYAAANKIIQGYIK